MFINYLVPEKVKAAMEIEANNQQCILKNNEQIRQEILKGKRLKIATLPVSFELLFF